MTHDSSQQTALAPAREPNVFVVLASQARRNSIGQLATTAFGGVINAAFLAQHTRLWWLSAAYVAVSAYGAWGLFDRWRPASEGAVGLPRVRRIVGGVGRTAIAAVGVLAVLAAAGGFMGAALGGWIH